MEHTDRLEVIALDYGPGFPVFSVSEPQAFGKQIQFAASGCCSTNAGPPPSGQVPGQTCSQCMAWYPSRCHRYLLVVVTVYIALPLSVFQNTPQISNVSCNDHLEIVVDLLKTICVLQ